jgi:hypothetical protein
VPSVALEVRSLPNGMSAARRQLREALSSQRLDPRHVDNVATVANELLIVAQQNGAATPVTLVVEPFAQLTSVRVKCQVTPRAVTEIFDVTERMLSALTIAFGIRPSSDVAVDLWAEVPRRLP